MTTPLFTAWYRRLSRERWRPIGTAATEAEAWEVAERYPLSGDKTVSSPGRDPNAEGKRKEKRT
jgi:hypothetical protein